MERSYDVVLISAASNVIALANAQMLASHALSHVAKLRRLVDIHARSRAMLQACARRISLASTS